MAGAPARVIERIRKTCLALPEAVEKSFGGHVSPGFRVRDKLFVVISEDRSYMTLKAPEGVQRILVYSDGERFFVPPYVGSKGWVGVRIALKEVKHFHRGLSCGGVVHRTKNQPAASGANKFNQLVAVERSEEHTSELQSLRHLVCRLLLEKK